MGCAGAAGELGVDFEEVTVEEDIVMAPLPEDGGTICLGGGVGVGAEVGFEGRGVLVLVVVDEVGRSG